MVGIGGMGGGVGGGGGLGVEVCHPCWLGGVGVGGEVVGRVGLELRLGLGGVCPREVFREIIFRRETAAGGGGLGAGVLLGVVLVGM